MRQFARGQQHQRFGLTRRLAPQQFDDRKQERQGLAGSGLGGADYVFAFERRRNGLLLDWSQGSELGCRQLLL